MSDVMLKEIVGRYTLSIHEIGKKAAQGEIVGDLIRSQVRRCLIEMQEADAEPDAIRAIFDDLARLSPESSPPVGPQTSKILAAMKLHVEFFLFMEEHHKQDGSPRKKDGSGFGFH
ncbi:hypothetical protein [Herbaspirillum frisingense]|uniref:hypothetical protein n=1 Tax=Herbaspirillum frisingense TaxID=92645 RepID=UPI001F3E1401|nr:hypothetical protein [Herbaspirillum frisingense]UIN20809.1 hypothetical protein LAZ82_20425 [Herbaspirillum frisingense]